MNKVINLEDFRKSKKLKESLKNNDNECQSEYINAFKKMTAQEIKMIYELLDD